MENNEKIKLLNLSEHPFIRTLLIDLSNVAKLKEITTNDVYFKEVHSAIQSIKYFLESLQIGRVLVAELHPLVKREWISSLSKENVLRYNIENYFLRITTYKDLIVKLVAKVYGAELPNTNSAENKLILFAKRNNEPLVEKIINSVNILIGSTKNIRNNIAHQGSSGDIDLKLIETYKDVVSFHNTIIKETIKEDEFDIAFFTLTLNKNIAEMMQIEEDLTTHLFQVLNDLAPQYENNKGKGA